MEEIFAGRARIEGSHEFFFDGLCSCSVVLIAAPEEHVDVVAEKRRVVLAGLFVHMGVFCRVAFAGAQCCHNNDQNNRNCPQE